MVSITPAASFHIGQKHDKQSVSLELGRAAPAIPECSLSVVTALRLTCTTSCSNSRRTLRPRLNSNCLYVLFHFTPAENHGAARTDKSAALSSPGWESVPDRTSLLCPRRLFMYTVLHLTILHLFLCGGSSLARRLCPPTFLAFTAQIWCVHNGTLPFFNTSTLYFRTVPCTFRLRSVLPLNRVWHKWLSSMQMRPWSLLRRDGCHKSSYYAMVSLLILLRHRCEIQ